MGVVLGGLLPWVDVFWEEVLGSDIDVFPSSSNSSSGSSGVSNALQDDPSSSSSTKEQDPDEQWQPGGSERSGLGADWNPVVRSVGAFVGIAFAIRRLPWQSTLQVSLTLALVNPVLWLPDRSIEAWLSAVVGCGAGGHGGRFWRQSGDCACACLRRPPKVGGGGDGNGNGLVRV